MAITRDRLGRFAGKGGGPSPGAANRANLKRNAETQSLKSRMKAAARADGAAAGKSASKITAKALESKGLRGIKMNSKDQSKWRNKLSTADRTAISKKLIKAGSPDIVASQKSSNRWHSKSNAQRDSILSRLRSIKGSK